MGVKISEAFPSKYVRAAEIAALRDQSVEVVMDRVEMEVVGSGADDGMPKPVLYFTGKAKGLVLNKINAAAIVAIYGDDTTAWKGQPLLLYQQLLLMPERERLLRLDDALCKADYQTSSL